ncbi:hypothetical protein KDK95_11525 [Actinospica sp. MGRD01-02]|uniref:Uncharacterized protein n=1 Tax=Actinospica acidithermotolerans TaxID=2828514 RepID=A0A941IG11_9ACTN|nr:hypothetical protein [Actinospica acidithermotolerans]MBR7826935.1 hypothetical protein [Actinospica acidithermotolerans]
MHFRTVGPGHSSALRDLAAEEDLLDYDSGLVALDGNGVVTEAILWQDSSHPITDQRGRLLAALHGSPPESENAQALRALVEAACADLPDEITQLRADISAHEQAGVLGGLLAQAGFEEHNLVVRKLVTQQTHSPAELPPGAVFRMLDRDNEAEFAFALGCIRASIGQGLATEPVGEAEDGRIAEYTEAWLDGIDGEVLRSYVIEYERELVAHALVSMTPAERGAESEAMIVDVLVPDARQKGHGWSRLLTARIEHLVAQEGVRSLAATVAALRGVRPQALLDNLQRAGWWVDTVTVLKRC